MSQELAIFVTGVVVGLAGNILVSVVNHLLELRRDKIKRERDRQSQLTVEGRRVLITTRATLEDIEGQQALSTELRSGWVGKDKPMNSPFVLSGLSVRQRIIWFISVRGLFTILVLLVGLIVAIVALWYYFPQVFFALVGVGVGALIAWGVIKFSKKTLSFILL